MAKAKVNIEKAQKALIERLSKATKETELLDEVGTIAVRNTKADARLGLDSETQERFQTFTGKDKEYIKRRRRIAKANGRGRSFKPTKANLTLTGQLLESIGYIVNSGKVFLQVTNDKRTPYEGVSAENTPTNSDLISWHASAAGSYPKRDALGVSEKTKETIRNKVRAFLRRTVLKRKR